jgi:hypothetical protein
MPLHARLHRLVATGNHSLLHVGCTERSWRSQGTRVAQLGQQLLRMQHLDAKLYGPQPQSRIRSDDCTVFREVSGSA